MSWSVEFDKVEGIIVLTYMGRSSGVDFRDASEKRIEVAKKNNSSKTLVDASRLITYESTTTDVFEIVDISYQEKGSRSAWKIAITMPSDKRSREQVSFYETVCVNRGWQVKKFESKEDAINWLHT